MALWSPQDALYAFKYTLPVLPYKQTKNAVSENKTPYRRLPGGAGKMPAAPDSALGMAPPSNSDLEAKLLGCMLLNPATIPDVRKWLSPVNEDAFYQRRFQVVYQTICKVDDTGEPLTGVKILSELERAGDTGLGISILPGTGKATDHRQVWQTVLQELVVQPGLPSDLQVCCLLLREYWMRRSIFFGCLDLSLSCEVTKPLDDLMTKLTDLNATVEKGYCISKEDHIGHIMKLAMGDIEARLKNGTLSGVTTGLGVANRNIGGFQNTDIILIAGRPGSGKTVAGVYHAYHAAREGTPVAFLSLEMPAVTIVYRMLSLISGVPYGDIQKASTMSQETLRAIHIAAGQLENLPIYFYDDAERDIADLSLMLREWKRRLGIGIVFMDYGQLIEDRTIRSGDDTAVAGAVSKQIQKLQRALRVPIVVMAQLNRECENRSNKRPRLSDIRSTGQWEQDATIVIGLYREDYYLEQNARDTGQSPDSVAATNEIEYGILKNRSGWLGTMVFGCNIDKNQLFDAGTQQQLPSQGSWSPLPRDGDEAPF